MKAELVELNALELVADVDGMTVRGTLEESCKGEVASKVLDNEFRQAALNIMSP